MSHRRAIIQFLIAALAAATASCRGDGVVAPPDTSPVVIAGTVPETGSWQADGLNMARGFRLAVEMLNESGGIDGRQVRLALYDDGSDPGRAARIYRDLAAADSVDALIGPFSSAVTEAVVPVAEQAGMPLVAPLAASPEIWAGKSRQWSVQMMNNARDHLAGAVEVAARHGVETVALVYENSRFPISAADGVRDAAAREGLTLVMDEAYPVEGADHSALTARARDLRADLFLGGGYTPDAVAFAKAVAGARYSPLLTSWTVGPSEPDFPDRVGVGAARCVIGNAPWVGTLDTSGPLANSATFQRRYHEAHGIAPGYTAAAGFGSVELLSEAIRASLAATGAIDNVAVRDHLFNTPTETVLGPFGVVPLGQADAGSQRLLVRLQLQWQDDGKGGLVQRVIYPDGAAEAAPCVNPPADIGHAAPSSLFRQDRHTGEANDEGQHSAARRVVPGPFRGVRHLRGRSATRRPKATGSWRLGAVS